MSFCRFSWDGSDVYVIEHAEGGFVCYCKKGYHCDQPEEMIMHLAEHRRNGDYVPRYAVEALWEEIDGPSDPIHPEPPAIRRYNEWLNRFRN